MTCTGYVVPTVTMKTYPKQKPWIDSSIRTKLKAQTTTFNHGKVIGNKTNSVVIPSLRQSNRQNVSIETKRSHISTAQTIQWLRRSTDNHGLESENHPPRFLASGQAINMFRLL